MNPFGQIIDLTGLNGIESGKTSLGSPINGEAKALGIDFLQILGGKLSGELPVLFGENQEAVEAVATDPDGIFSDKMADSLALLSDLSGSQTIVGSNQLTIQKNLIDINGLNSKQAFNIKIDGEISNQAISSLDEIVSSTNQNVKADIRSSLPNQAILSSDTKIDNLNLNSLKAMSLQNNIEKSEADIRPVVTAEVDAELKAQNVADPKTTSLLDKVAGSLNIKNVKIEKNTENRKSDNEPVKLALPTKSYIKVSTLDANSNSTNSQLTGSNQNMFQGSTEIIAPEVEISNNERNKLSNIEAIARVEIDKLSAGKIETGQPIMQTKVISDNVTGFANNIEKVEFTETKIDTTSVKFVMPAEIKESNFKNNHTVMIRMEPDHLGPVRMTVSTHNDTMTARLIVDSPLAKATVESNLNNLVEQLDKHGIKVDILDVSVSGGNDEQQTQENRFSGFARNARQNLKSYENSNVIDNVMAQRAVEHLYIDTSGVNCFA